MPGRGKYVRTQAHRDLLREQARAMHASGKFKRKKPMSDEERAMHRQRLQSPEVQAKIKATQQTPEYKAQAAERARQRCAAGTFRRKTEPSEEERKAKSERMKHNNPVQSAEVRAKISQTLRAQSEDLAARLQATRDAGKLPHIPMTEETRKSLSERMKRDNPMRRPEIAAKRAMYERWRNFADPKGVAERWIRAGTAPNKDEQKLHAMIEHLGFRFVGSGDFWIGPCKSGKCRNPDFIYKSGRNKTAILLNGAYWHQRPNRNDAEELADYADKGWRVLTIMTTELREPMTVLTKIQDWLAGLKSQA